MIHVHGYLGELSPATRELAKTATLVVGGRRHLADLGVEEERQVVLGALTPALERIAQAGPDADVLVVASGDPGFHGIVRRIRLAGHRVTVSPAVSSIAAAFASVALPWDDALAISAHGKPVDEAVAAARWHRKVAVLTGPGAGIRELAAAIEVPRTYVLAERLGESDERVRILSRDEAIALDDVAEPNVVLILDGHPDDESLIAVATAPIRYEAGEPVIGQLVNSPAARRRADEIDKALGVESRRYDGPAATRMPVAWQECDLIVSHLALGATTRIVAPLLRDKKTDPGVVVVDEAGRFAVPLVGGHAGGANDLARRISEGTGSTAVLTTATDALNLPALDTLGWAYSGDVAGVTRALIDGRPVRVEKEHPWALPPLPGNVSVDAEDAVARIVVTDRAAVESSDVPTVVLHPKSLIVGMGCNRGTSVEVIRELLEQTLAENNLAIESVAAITTVDLKAGEIGFLQLVKQLGVPLIDYPADELAQQDVPTPSAMVQGHVSTPSVSEASVMARGAELIVPKQKNTDATCAIGRAAGARTAVGGGPWPRFPRPAHPARHRPAAAGHLHRRIRPLRQADPRPDPARNPCARLQDGHGGDAHRRRDRRGPRGRERLLGLWWRPCDLCHGQPCAGARHRGHRHRRGARRHRQPRGLVDLGGTAGSRSRHALAERSAYRVGEHREAAVGGRRR